MSEGPESCFTAVAAAHPRCFWLDGGGARDWSGSRSLVGWLDEDDVSLTYDASLGEVRRHTGGTSTVVGEDVFAVLEAELAAGSSGNKGGSKGGEQWFGYLGYAARPDLPAGVVASGGSRLPDAVWMRPSHLRLFDHGAPPAPSSSGPAPAPHEPMPPSYATAFAQVQEQLHAGNSYEVNLTYRLRAGSQLDPLAAYLALRASNPAPYAGLLQHDVPGHRAWLLSSSPERYAVVRRASDGVRTIETKPIKGTTPRAPEPGADEAARRRLANDARFRAENLMIVDLLRNDLAMVCEVGSVEVPVLMDVESYPSVHQLVSTVRGRLRADVSTPAALRALFPAGSMTGAPKLRTMEIIEAVEATPRGVYAGAFGWVAADGRADLGVVIRSLTTAGDGRWEVGTGGGITVHSDVDGEWAESCWKAERLLAVLSR